MWFFSLTEVRLSVKIKQMNMEIISYPPFPSSHHQLEEQKKEDWGKRPRTKYLKGKWSKNSGNKESARRLEQTREVMESEMEGVGDWKKEKLRVCWYKGNGKTDRAWQQGWEKGGEYVERSWDKGQMVYEVLQIISHWLMAVMLGCCEIVRLKFNSGFLASAGFDLSSIFPTSKSHDKAGYETVWTSPNTNNSVTRVPVVVLA